MYLNTIHKFRERIFAAIVFKQLFSSEKLKLTKYFKTKLILL